MKYLLKPSIAQAQRVLRQAELQDPLRSIHNIRIFDSPKEARQAIRYLRRHYEQENGRDVHWSRHVNIIIEYT